MKDKETKRLRRSQRDYNVAFKLAVISRVEKGEMTYKQAQSTYGIEEEVQSWSGSENLVT